MRDFSVLKKREEEEKALLKQCKKIIQSTESSAVVILYGSRARGDGLPESDYDLLVLVDESPVDLKKEDLIRRQLFPLELETGYVFTVNVYSRQEWESPVYRAMPFCQNVEREGIIL